ncbi:coilin isoform 2-T2 [Thomomys bottae]
MHARVKLEEREILEDPVIIRNGSELHSSSQKAKKRTLKLVEDEENELGYNYSKKQWKRQKNSSSHEKALDLEPKAGTDHTMKKKKRRSKAPCGTMAEQEEETKKMSPKKKEKYEYKKHIRNSKSSGKEWSTQNTSSPKSSVSLTKARRKGGGTKVSPGTSSESSSSQESSSDELSNVTSVAGNSLDKLSVELSKEGAATKNPAVNKMVAKTSLNLPTSKVKAATTFSSSSDSSSDSDDQLVMTKNSVECAPGSVKTAGPFAGRGCPGSGQPSQAPNAMGWKPGDSNGIRQTSGPSPSMPVSNSLGRGWGRGEPWKGVRGRGLRGRGRGRGNTVSCVLHRSTEYQKQQQLSEIVSNSSTIIQNPAEIHKKDYNLLPLLAAAPRVGEKIAFKLLELTPDYTPDVSDYKEGKILSHNPETEQVDIEILSSLPALKEPGKFDLVYHNENGTEVVEYAVTQERKISVFWRELIDPRLIVESSANITRTELA